MPSFALPSGAVAGDVFSIDAVVAGPGPLNEYRWRRKTMTVEVVEPCGGSVVQVPSDCAPTLQQGIDLVDEGGAIFIAPGEYEGQQNVVFWSCGFSGDRKSYSLVGTGAPEEVVLRPCPDADWGWAIADWDGDVSLSNLTVFGIRKDSGALTVTNSIVMPATTQLGPDQAINKQGSGPVTLSQTEVVGEVDIQPGSLEPQTDLRLVATENAFGGHVYLNGTSGLNVLERNLFRGGDACLTVVWSAARIERNQFVGCNEWQVVLGTSSEGPLTDVDFRFNDLEGMGFVGTAFEFEEGDRLAANCNWWGDASGPGPWGRGALVHWWSHDDPQSRLLPFATSPIAESGRTSCVGTQPSPDGPNLVPTDLDGPSGASAGDDINVSFRVENRGASVAPGGWLAGIYLSTNATITSGDTRLGGYYRSSTLDPGVWIDETVRVTVPDWVSEGDYFIGIIVDEDDEVDEGEGEDDNTAFDASGIAISGASVGLPDLVITGMSFPSAGTRGESIPVGVTTRNTGEAPADRGFSVRVYLSRDFSITTADVEICRALETAELGVGASVTTNLSCTIPPGIDPRVYRIGALVDVENWMPEIDDDNNDDVGGSITIN